MNSPRTEHPIFAMDQMHQMDSEGLRCEESKRKKKKTADKGGKKKQRKRSQLQDKREGWRPQRAGDSARERAFKPVKGKGKRAKQSQRNRWRGKRSDAAQADAEPHLIRSCATQQAPVVQQQVHYFFGPPKITAFWHSIGFPLCHILFFVCFSCPSVNLQSPNLSQSAATDTEKTGGAAGRSNTYAFGFCSAWGVLLLSFFCRPWRRDGRRRRQCCAAAMQHTTAVTIVTEPVSAA